MARKIWKDPIPKKSKKNPDWYARYVDACSKVKLPDKVVDALLKLKGRPAREVEMKLRIEKLEARIRELENSKH